MQLIALTFTIAGGFQVFRKRSHVKKAKGELPIILRLFTRRVGTVAPELEAQIFKLFLPC